MIKRLQRYFTRPETLAFVPAHTIAVRPSLTTLERFNVR